MLQKDAYPSGSIILVEWNAHKLSQNMLGKDHLDHCHD